MNHRGEEGEDRVSRGRPKRAKREEEDEPEARGTFALDRRTPSRDVMIFDATIKSFVVYAIPSTSFVTRVALAPHGQAQSSSSRRRLASRVRWPPPRTSSPP